MSPGETLNVEDSSIDLLTVCQAVHWFDLDTFYKEVKRVLKPNGVLALYGYFTPIVKNEPEINQMIDQLYHGTLRRYFHPKIKALEESYKNLPFPFQNVTRSYEKHIFEMESDLNHLANWFKTWSGWQEYKKKNGEFVAEKLMRDFLFNASKVLKGGSQVTLVVNYFAVIGSK